MDRTDEAAHKRLVDAMTTRRDQLRLRWDAIAAGAGITAAHLGKFRRGETGLRPRTIAGLERMLRWKAGAFSQIMAGQDPIDLDDDGDTKQPAAVKSELIAELRAMEGGTLIWFTRKSMSEKQRERVAEMAKALALELMDEDEAF
jgi:hypothetical protein